MFMSTEAFNAFRSSFKPIVDTSFHADTTRLVAELYKKRQEFENTLTQTQAIELFEQLLLSGDILKYVKRTSNLHEIAQELIYVPGQQAEMWQSKYERLLAKWVALKEHMINTFELDLHNYVD